MNSSPEQPWETRSGEKLENAGPRSGEDLAALQRRQNALKRDRVAVAQQKQAQSQADLNRLEERAKLQRVKEIVQSKVFKLTALSVTAVIVLGIGGWIITHPSAQAEDFQNTLPRINLQAAQQLGADAQPQIKETEKAWEVSYLVRPGSLTFDTRRTVGPCGAVYRVSKDQPSQDVLRWTTVVMKPCRSK